MFQGLNKAAAGKAAAFFMTTLMLMGTAEAQLLVSSAAPSAAVASATAAATASASPSARLARCASCHGTDGNSTLANSPSLAGQPKVFLENTLIMIREGLRPIAAMDGLLDGVSDAEIVALAEHFSKQTPRGAEAPREETTFTRGQTLASRNLCGACHLPTFVGQQQMPRLASQREDYLVHTMQGFRDNKAQGRDTQMNGVLRGYSDQDISALAHYFSRMP